MGKETWRRITRFPGYEVSDFGRIRNANGKIMKPSSNGNGYLKFRRRVNGKYISDYVHRIVAEAFIPNPDNLPQINHKDENPLNNAVDNLEWCTAEYNNAYGTAKIRAIDTKSNPIEQLTLGGKRIAIYRSTRIAAELLGINRGTLKDAVIKNRPCKGYYWKYSDITF